MITLETIERDLERCAGIPQENEVTLTVGEYGELLAAARKWVEYEAQSKIFHDEYKNIRAPMKRIDAMKALLREVLDIRDAELPYKNWPKHWLRRAEEELGEKKR